MEKEKIEQVEETKKEKTSLFKKIFKRDSKKDIIEKAKRITRQNTVHAIIGGFHLFETDTRLEKTIQYFIDNNIKELYPCHCVSLQAKSKMINNLNVKEVAVSMHLEF